MSTRIILIGSFLMCVCSVSAQRCLKAPCVCGSTVDAYLSSTPGAVSVAAYYNGANTGGAAANSCQIPAILLPGQTIAPPNVPDQTQPPYRLGQDGLEYQCVEFVRRFYREAKHADSSGWRGRHGDAQDFYVDSGYFGLARYSNGGTVPPQADDIIGFAGVPGISAAGHVAIVKNVDTSRCAASGIFSVNLIEQNTNQVHSLTGTCPAQGSAFVYTLSPRCSACLPIQGWMRLPGPIENPVVNQYAIPTASSNPAGITMGPDGAVWFTEAQLGTVATVGRITTSGVITEFPLPNKSSYPTEIAAGSDGALWFTERFGDNIARITTNGSLIEYPIPGVSPASITAGPDGNLWFTFGQLTNRFSGTQIGMIGRMTPSGTLTTFSIPVDSTIISSGTQFITTGPDRNLWLTVSKLSQFGQLGYIDRITTSGAITEFSVGSASPYKIIAGPDGNLWFTDFQLPTLGKMMTSGTITDYQLPASSGNDMARGVAAGSDGAVWFVRTLGCGLNVTDCSKQIGQINSAGVITVYALPNTSNGYPGDLTTGPDGNLWFAAPYSNSINQFELTGQ